MGSSTSEITLLLSRTLRETRRGRNPCHAGDGPDAGASPAFPFVAPPLGPCSSSAWKEARQPALSAEMRSAVAIANAHLLVGQAVDGEVLSELPVGEIVSTELPLPIVIGVRLIDEDRPVLAAVPS